MQNLRQGMVSIFLAMAIKDKFIHIKGSLERFRDFIFIDDVVNAFINIESNKNSFAKIYNVGTGVRTSIKILLNELISTITFSINYKVEGGTAGDQHGIYADINLMKDEIGWESKIKLKDGLKRMVKDIL